MLAFVGPLVVDHLIRLDHLPARGEFLQAELAGELVGGCMANSAIQAARLGSETTLISKLGGDERGRRALGYLQSIPHLRLRLTESHGLTPLSLVLSEGDERTIIATEGLETNRLGRPDAAITSALGAASYAMIDIRDPELCAAYHQLARGRRVLPLLHFAEAGVRSLGWDVVVGSIADGVPAIGELEGVGCKLCVVTEGSAGLRYWEHGRSAWAHLPALPLSETIDVTGAGDCFAAGLLVGLNRGWTTVEALALAVRCGAEACGFIGGHPQ